MLEIIKSEVLANRKIQNDVKTSLGLFEKVDKNVLRFDLWSKQ